MKTNLVKSNKHPSDKFTRTRNRTSKKLEIETEDKVKELESEIKRLCREIEEKEYFFAREKRRSQNFFDEVVEAEIKFEDELNEQNSVIAQLDKEIIRLGERNFQEGIKSKDVGREKFAIEAQELTVLNRNMITPIRH
ncbi:hypothetical protein JTB14_025160 [Gonioctena quinquepunctata]|nr:hypothetical protein JTB14_025160 [Gonioctena quinquepunctata]